MKPSGEGLLAKVASIAAILGLVIAYLAWKHPVVPASGAPAPTPDVTQPGPDNPHRDLPDEPQSHTDSTDVTPVPPLRPVVEPPVRPEPPAEPKRVCGAPKTLTLRPGPPVAVAAGLALLSVKAQREGTEEYLTLGIASDKQTLTEMVLGTPSRYAFGTSLGIYYVNVSQADLSTGRMTVQVGCEGTSEEHR